MAFFDRFKKWYQIKVRCYNCGNTQDCKVPKGITIDNHLRTEAATCENCGNPTLRRIERIRVPADVQTPVKEYVSAPAPRQQFKQAPRLPPIPPRERMNIRPHPRPRPRPADVQYPVTEPVPVQEEEENNQQPDWNIHPKKINLWTGREER